MRVIAGKHRSRVLKQFDGQAIRPTADKVKEALFGKLQFRIYGSVCLDLFSGTGALGIEALSRGAKEVVFVDGARDSVKITKENLKMLRETAEVSFSDSLTFLRSTDKVFDFIFIDPPYKTDLGIKSLEIIGKRDLLKEDGIAVFESDCEFTGEVEGLKMTEKKKYGKTYLSFFIKL